MIHRTTKHLHIEDQKVTRQIKFYQIYFKHKIWENSLKRQQFQDEIEISFMRKFFLLTTNDDCKQRTRADENS